MKNRTTCFLLTLLLISCGPTVYKATNFKDVTKNHKTVAILPPVVTVQLRPNEAKRTTPEALEKTEIATSKAIQEKLYSWFLRRSDKYKYTVRFQDISETNALLYKAHTGYQDLTRTSKSDLAKILGVDAVISTSVRTDKPMSEGAAVALGVVLGAWGNTNTAYTTIDIHEAQGGSLIWKYDYQAAGSVGSSPENLVNALMRNASKNFPYNNGRQ